MKNRTTDEMATELEQVKELNRFLEENMDNFTDTDFPSLLKELIDRKKINKAQLAKASGMSDVYLYQILGGRRTPSRSRMICICIGLSLSVNETQDLLIHAGMGPLYAKNRWDAIIIESSAENPVHPGCAGMNASVRRFRTYSFFGHGHTFLNKRTCVDTPLYVVTQYNF